MATGTSSFDEAMKYALERLASGHLTLKEEQLKSHQSSMIERVCLYGSQRVLAARAYAHHAIPFVMDHELGLSGTSESSSMLSLLLRCKPRPLHHRASLRLDKHAREWIALVSVHQALPSTTWEPGDEARLNHCCSSNKKKQQQKQQQQQKKL